MARRERLAGRHKGETPAPSDAVLLRWSQQVPSADVQDPLGLALRGSSRNASRLLYCITSITPRARYFSFIPWCVYDWDRREKGRVLAPSLKEAIILRERALVLGCVAHHDGQACPGGALVGSSRVARWFAKNHADADLKTIPFAQNPALGAYINSLINLGFFLETNEADDIDEEWGGDLTFDNLKLSPTGIRLAEAYDNCIGTLRAVKGVIGARPRVAVKRLREFGRDGGLCALVRPVSRDRGLLRDVFFARGEENANSHTVRRESLLLILELCRQAEAHEVPLGEREFSTAVYFDELVTDGRVAARVEWPSELADIATRWRMFQFHQYMAIALEGMFAWVVAEASRTGLAGVTIDKLVRNLDSRVATRLATERCGSLQAGPFGALTPAMSLGSFAGGRASADTATSRLIDGRIRAASPCSEDNLEALLRSDDLVEPSTVPTLSLLLLAVTLARYIAWDGTRYGNWLAQAARDPFVDLVPPVLIRGLVRRFGDWWTRRWDEIAAFVISRYVIQQHQSMSFEKTAAGDRCLLHVDGARVVASGSYDRIGIRNQRLPSALRILKDLDLLREDHDGLTHLTAAGRRVLDEDLRAVGRQ